MRAGLGKARVSLSEPTDTSQKRGAAAVILFKIGGYIRHLMYFEKVGTGQAHYLANQGRLIKSEEPLTLPSLSPFSSVYFLFFGLSPLVRYIRGVSSAPRRTLGGTRRKCRVSPPCLPEAAVYRLEEVEGRRNEPSMV
ncbi:hypothetical protein KFK09_007439 [Dendrobium nobile]|uniref:Uncharacterized protein n=1 Tax=Dendrobium nobile TaxID=94219 RepID=A0A8T3BRX2_DENNO|nr:hypothetical protein KFK09_007439 [Dendrobium nobile]